MEWNNQSVAQHPLKATPLTCPRFNRGITESHSVSISKFLHVAFKTHPTRLSTLEPNFVMLDILNNVHFWVIRTLWMIYTAWFSASNLCDVSWSILCNGKQSKMKKKEHRRRIKVREEQNWNSKDVRVLNWKFLKRENGASEELIGKQIVQIKVYRSNYSDTIVLSALVFKYHHEHRGTTLYIMTVVHIIIILALSNQSVVEQSTEWDELWLSN